MKEFKALDSLGWVLFCWKKIGELFDLGDGVKAKAPSQTGVAGHDCNCRCFLEYNLLTVEEFEKKTGRKGEKKAVKTDLQEIDNDDIMESGILPKPIGSSRKNYDALFKGLNKLNVEYNPVVNHIKKIKEEDIISALSGGDLTGGSCASVGLAYIGQKQGWNVLDFRGGDSASFFSNVYNIRNIFESKEIKMLTATGANTATVGKNLLKQCEKGKEYYLFVGRHASIVRKTIDGKLQYLELQSHTKSGWTDFDGNVRYTLVNRFGCSSKSNKFSQNLHAMIDLNESDFDNTEFKLLMGFINTAESKQKKGVAGYAK